MKYKKIAAFIKKRKYLGIHTAGKEQWITDGVASYPIIGMPVMSAAEMLAFLDFQANDDIKVTEWKALEVRFGDTALNEELIERFGPSVSIGESSCSVFYTSAGAVLVNDAYLTPCFTHYGEGELTFWLRYCNNHPMIAVKKGFFLLALINPVKTWGIGDHTLDRYEELCKNLRLANANFKETEESDDENT